MNLLQALLSRLFFSICYLGLVHELLEIPRPDQLFDLVLEGHALVCGMPYLPVKYTVSFNVMGSGGL